MATVPTTHTFADGLATSSEANSYIRDPIAFLLSKPAAQLRQDTGQSLNNDTWTSITLTTEDLDSDPSGTGGHSNSVNTSRFTAVYAGWYRCGGLVCFDTNATGARSARLAVNGTARNGSAATVQAVTGGVYYTQVPTPVMEVYLNVGDYVELQGRQESGGALSTIVNGAESSSLSVSWDRS